MKNNGEINSKVIFFSPIVKQVHVGVAIGYYGNSSLELLRMENDKVGHMLIIHVKVPCKSFLLINLHNSNTESEQISRLSNLCNILNSFYDLSNKTFVFDADFNLFFETKLEALGGNPILKKKKSLTK